MKLKTQLHANGTNIEGEWDEVFAAVRRCHEAVHAMGAPPHRHHYPGRHSNGPGPDDG
jgi:uncharacterized protein YqgV (UPF0045/DUF77 family)